MPELTDAQLAILNAVVESRKPLAIKVKPKSGVVWHMEKDIRVCMLSLAKLTELGHATSDVAALEAAHMLQRWEPTDTEAKAMVARWAPPGPPAVILTSLAAEMLRVTLCERLERVEVFARLPNGKLNPGKKVKVTEEAGYWDCVEHAEMQEKRIRRLIRYGRQRDLEVDLESLPDSAPGPEYLADLITGEVTDKVEEVAPKNRLFSVLGTTGVFPVAVSKKPLKGKS